MASVGLMQFDLAAIASAIAERRFKRVAVQFPDELLSTSFSVVRDLKARVPKSTAVFIVADSVGDCCVDEVSAKHYDADVVVNFSLTPCFSPSRDVPYLVALPLLQDGSAEADVGDPRAAFGFKENFVFMEPKQRAVFTNDFNDRLTKCVFAGFKSPDASLVRLLSAKFPFLNELVYLNLNTNESNTLEVNFSKTRAASLRNATQVVSNAQTVGVLVGTVNVDRFVEMMDVLRKACVSAGKTPYTIFTAKPNEAKLANFPEMDVWVHVACEHRTFLTNVESMVPVISPAELLAGLSVIDVEDRRLTNFDELSPVGAMVSSTSQALSLNVESAAGDKLSSNWRGLGADDDSETQKPARAAKGRTGTASGYDRERD